jgi:DTW domain-containing protein YfiP
MVSYFSTIDSDNIVVLFPSEIALSYDEFCVQRDIKRNAQSDDHSKEVCVVGERELYIIIVDGVWRHARRMAHRLREILPSIRHVQLTPEQMSIYARTQSQPDRICSIEAAALFLSHCGETEEVTNGLIECVKVNNLALQYKIGHTSNRKPIHSLYSKGARHPCWYFGDYYLYKKALTEANNTSRRKNDNSDSDGEHEER